MSDPYSPPSARPARPRHSPALKYVYLVAYALNVALSAGAFVVMQADVSALHARQALDLFTALDVGARLVAVAAIVIACIWIHKAWSALPPAFRTSRSGRTITPGAAVGFLLVPCFNVYWMFVVSTALCDAVGDLLAHYGRARPLPRTLAVVACILQLIPGVNLLAAPALWFVYMARMDAALREMLALLDRDGVIAPDT